MRGRRVLTLVILLGATLAASLQVTAQNQNSPARRRHSSPAERPARTGARPTATG